MQFCRGIKKGIYIYTEMHSRATFPNFDFRKFDDDRSVPYERESSRKTRQEEIIIEKIFLVFFG